MSRLRWPLERPPDRLDVLTLGFGGFAGGVLLEHLAGDLLPLAWLARWLIAGLVLARLWRTLD